MRVVFRRSFARDLKKSRAQTLRRELQAVIEQIEQSTTLYDVPNIKRLSGDGTYFRIGIGDYRLGLSIDNDTVTAVRFLHRRDIYRYFP